MKRPEIYLEPNQRAAEVIELLEKEYPNAKTALNYSNPLGDTCGHHAFRTSN